MAEDMLFMQQEAARRVHRMQEHSRRVFAEHQEHTPDTAVQPPEKSDTEQWMLLGLALLLFRSGCRPELAVALLYLAM